jgi:hypothetical protein
VRGSRLRRRMLPPLTPTLSPSWKNDREREMRRLHTVNVYIH